MAAQAQDLASQGIEWASPRVEDAAEKLRPVIKDAQTSGAPAKSLHHGDHASVSPVAVETTDKPAVTEASNVRKPTGTEASPAPAPATASPDAAGSPASAPVAASEVAQAVAPQDMPFVSGNTVEAMVAEMLRPLLKDWLDANLPAIVEAQVRKEVERIARSA